MILKEGDPEILVQVSHATQEKPKKKARKPLDVFGIIVCIAVAALFVLVVLIYIFRWNVPGLTGKNLWDWLQLLIIPAVLAVGGIWFNYATGIT